MKEAVKPNHINRADNIAHAHGVWVNGVYRDNGIPRPPKEKGVKHEPYGTIFILSKRG